MTDTTNSFMEKATLNYMINPVYDAYNKDSIFKKHTNHNVNKEEQKFYKKRIVSITRDLFKDNEHPEYLQNIHTAYIHHIIQYIKLIDTKDILQEEYNALEIKNPINCCDVNPDTIAIANECVYNIKPKAVTLDNFVTKTPTTKTKNIKPPRKKNINLKNPDLKHKGLKTKQRKADTST